MSRKAAQPVAVPPPAPEKLVQASVINLKGSEECRDWLKHASKKTYISAAQIVRLGLAMWAEKNGIEAPPER